jgi:hypothetical protein
MMDACRTCHGYAYDKWADGGHNMTYADFLLNEKHNQSEQLNDDCFRCHGMFFQGRMQDAAEPLNTEGPWELVSNSLRLRPAIPCMTCHAVHSVPAQLTTSDSAIEATPTGTAARRTADLCMFSRTERQPIPAADVPLPAVIDGSYQPKVAEDRTTRLCFQCHAPNSHLQLGSSDDRTPIGVHEGIGCAQCHRAHSQDATNSCAECHPRLSNCGLDVKTMNTSFADPNSSHNIHTVACQDYHPDQDPPP